MRSSVVTAALLMLACTLLIAGTTLLAKAMGNGSLGMAVHPLMVSNARFVFGFLTVLAALGLRRAAGRPAWVEPVGGAPRPAWGIHALRTFLGWVSGGLMFAAAAQMPLADVSALGFLSPVATLFLAMTILDEKVGPWRWTAVALALVGAAILLRPGAGAIQPAALLALGAAATMGMEAVVIKRLATTEPPGRTMIINNGMGAVLASVVGVFFFTWPQGAGLWAALVAMGSVMVTAQILLLTANRVADASFVAPFFYLSLVWAAVYDILVFGVWPDAVTVTGAAIIVSGGMLMTWREIRARRVIVAPVLLR